MEYLNKIELCGNVGNIHVSEVSDGVTATRFSLAVVGAYDGGATFFLDTTWFNCLAWSDKVQTASELKKEDVAHVIGRLRQAKYSDAQGNERTTYEVIVNSLEIIKRP